MSGSGPLSGIRVVDLTSVILGPFGTRILADLGADVIRIEHPEGDAQRYYQPARSPGMSGAVMNLMRNKRSLALDLKQEAGREALRKLLGHADVVVHSMRSAAIERLGLSYSQVRELNPDIIYCAAGGYASSGPYAGRPAYDDLIQAISGLAMLNQRDGEPAYLPTVVCDKLSGQTLAWAVMAALVQKARGGGGQEVEVSMFEASVDFVLVEHLYNTTFWPTPEDASWGYPRLLSKHRRPYPAKDGYVAMMPYSDKNWRDVFDFIGRPELKEREDFAQLKDRPKHYDFLYSLLTEAAPGHSVDEWCQFCAHVDIPFAPVLDLGSIERDEHAQAVGMIRVVEHPTEGLYRTVRSPATFSAAPWEIRRHAPHIGEHSREILGEIGYDAAEISRLNAAGVTKAEDTPAPSNAPSSQ